MPAKPRSIVRSSERLSDIASARQSSAAFERVLSVFCEVHNAYPGQPCWAVLERWKIAKHRAVRASAHPRYVSQPSRRAPR